MTGMDRLDELGRIRNAVKAARERTADPRLSVQVGASGAVDIVRAVPPESGRGRYVVTIVRASLSVEEAIRALDELK